jgi:hypothetical protein
MITVDEETDSNSTLDSSSSESDNESNKWKNKKLGKYLNLDILHTQLIYLQLNVYISVNTF